ncbi:MAG TPA: hypothetical protein VFK45_10445 [Gammaproteobacteria bacterium]|nr:hypothetical protein [Gammaproteobacteria bacterium]
MKTVFTILLTGLLGAGLAAPALAAGNQNANAGQSMQRPYDAGVFRGQITDIKTIEFDNGQRYVLAKIKDQQGHTAVINLGTVNNVKQQQTQLRPGETVVAFGRGGRLNGKPILVVYSLHVAPNGTGTQMTR